MKFSMSINTLKNNQFEVAHIVKTDGDVGAMFHLEPNHNPRSGEPAQVWFALTTSGGRLIPLEDCDCRLEVFTQGDRSEAIASPELTAISAENYQNIPGADVVFPEAGIYELVLQGTPQNEGNFREFTLTYDVTVRPGTRTSELPSETPSEPQSEPHLETQSREPNLEIEPNGMLGVSIWEGMIVGLVIIVAGGWWWMRSRKV